jgi:cell division protein FtsX
MNWASLLMGLVGPMAVRVLISLGLSVITYTGATLVLNNASNAAKAAFGGMAPDVLQLLALAGLFQAMSIVIGAIAGGIALMTFKRIGFASGT